MGEGSFRGLISHSNVCDEVYSFSLTQLSFRRTFYDYFTDRLTII